MVNPVGGFSEQIVPTITVTASSAYSSGDVLGGAIELAKAVRGPGGSATLQTLMVSDVAEQDAAIELLVFDSEPGQTYTDHEACPTLAADISKLIAKITIAAADYTSIGGLAINDIAGLGQAAAGGEGRDESLGRSGAGGHPDVCGHDRRPHGLRLPAGLIDAALDEANGGARRRVRGGRGVRARSAARDVDG